MTPSNEIIKTLEEPDAATARQSFNSLWSDPSPPPNRQSGDHAKHPADDESPDPHIFRVSSPEFPRAQPQLTISIHGNAHKPAENPANEPAQERREGQQKVSHGCCSP
jgi:hypothetical protein